MMSVGGGAPTLTKGVKDMGIMIVGVKRGTHRLMK